MMINLCLLSEPVAGIEDQISLNEIVLCPESTASDVFPESTTEDELAHLQHGFSRRDVFWTLPLAVVSILAGCKKNRVEPSSKGDVELMRRVRVLNGYLRVQKVVDLKKVNGVFVVEQYLQNPSVIPSSLGTAVYETVKAKRAEKAAFVYFDLKPDIIISPRGVSIVPNRSPIYLFISSKLIPLINGTPAERNMFDTILYHEVEGHAANYRGVSDQVRIYTMIHLASQHDPTLNMALMKIFKAVDEVVAHVREVDRLINKVGLYENPNVLPKKFRIKLEKGVGELLQVMFEAFGKKPPSEEIRLIFNMMRSLVLKTINESSEKTQHYLRQLMKKSGMKAPVTFK